MMVSGRPPVSVGLARFGGLVASAIKYRKVEIMAIAMAPERQLIVPQGTLMRLAWTEPERGRPDGLTLRLSLDNEIEEYTLRIAPEVAAELIQFFQRGTHTGLEPEAPRLHPLAQRQVPGPTPPRWAEALFMRT
jgi:hypothetical protein